MLMLLERIIPEGYRVKVIVGRGRIASRVFDINENFFVLFGFHAS